MSEKMEVVPGDASSPEVHEVTEKINTTTVESLIPRVKCPEHIVSMQELAFVHVNEYAEAFHVQTYPDLFGMIVVVCVGLPYRLASQVL